MKNVLKVLAALIAWIVIWKVFYYGMGDVISDGSARSWIGAVVGITTVFFAVMAQDGFV